jgi:hypothetical protein
VLILFAFVLLILAAAVGVLFAMCAELGRRVGTGSSAAEPARYVRPLGRAGVYLRAEVAWPAQLAGLRAEPAFLLLVLSTSCSSCNTIAEQLGKDGWAERSGGRLGVLLSTPDPQVAEEFVTRYGLAAFPLSVDFNGDWAGAALGLALSPVGLVFRHNQLAESYVFNHVEPLWTTFTEVMEWEPHTHPQTHPAESAVVASSAPSAQVV